MESRDYSVSERSAAYELSRKSILKAKRERLKFLDFDQPEYRPLSAIPMEIAEHPRLSHLNLQGTQVSDLSPLQTITSLQTLNLGNTLAKDLPLLEALTGLQDLRLDNTQIVGLSPLQALTGLRRLFLNGTQVADLSPLQALTGLRELRLDNTKVTDLSPLQALTGLQSLWLNNTQAADLSPLRALTGLQVLYLDNTRVADLSPLRALTGLQVLRLDHTEVVDPSPLQALTELRTLYLSNTHIADLSPLQALTELQSLDLHNTKVADLLPLQTPTRLQRLDLDNTQVTDLLPLAGLSKLGEGNSGGLWFGGTPAAERDAAHRALAAINDDQDRAKQIRQYLNGEHPEFVGPPEPYAPPKPPSPPEQQRGGVRFRLADDYLEPLIEGEIGPRAEIMKRSVREALEALNRPLSGQNEFPEPAQWAAETLALVRGDLDEINAQGFRLWFLSQKFARRQEADDKAQRDPAGMARIMSTEMREALDGVVASLPLFLRQFPECRAMDAEVEDWQRDRALEPSVTQVFVDVRSFDVVTQEVGETLQEALPEEDGKHADRDARAKLFTARNLVFAGLGVVATAAVTEATLGVVDGTGIRPTIARKVQEWLGTKPEPVGEIMKGAPADQQASVRAYLKQIREAWEKWKAQSPGS